eukprot:GEMP01026932.1.p1 GENE.GEMP01026932.1~~GEMP01026932.1.p1  ORF type:complete len:607 (+),score=51.92 GEMP01026932.1:206-2026(+)
MRFVQVIVLLPLTGVIGDTKIAIDQVKSPCNPECKTGEVCKPSTIQPSVNECVPSYEINSDGCPDYSKDLHAGHTWHNTKSCRKFCQYNASTRNYIAMDLAAGTVFNTELGVGDHHWSVAKKFLSPHCQCLKTSPNCVLCRGDLCVECKPDFGLDLEFHCARKCADGTAVGCLSPMCGPSKLTCSSTQDCVDGKCTETTIAVPPTTKMTTEAKASNAPTTTATEATIKDTPTTTTTEAMTTTDLPTTVRTEKCTGGTKDTNNCSCGASNQECTATQLCLHGTTCTEKCDSDDNCLNNGEICVSVAEHKVCRSLPLCSDDSIANCACGNSDKYVECPEGETCDTNSHQCTPRCSSSDKLCSEGEQVLSVHDCDKLSRSCPWSSYSNETLNDGDSFPDNMSNYFICINFDPIACYFNHGDLPPLVIYNKTATSSNYRPDSRIGVERVEQVNLPVDCSIAFKTDAIKYSRNEDVEDVEIICTKPPSQDPVAVSAGRRRLQDGREVTVTFEAGKHTVISPPNPNAAAAAAAEKSDGVANEIPPWLLPLLGAVLVLLALLCVLCCCCRRNKNNEVPFEEDEMLRHDRAGRARTTDPRNKPDKLDGNRVSLE